MMILFATPASIRSNWIYYEAGYCYGQGVRVVPVGFLGVDIASLTPPLSLLQGFNISSEDHLDNLIALSNEEFKCAHKEQFTHKEYLEVVAGSGLLGESVLGIHSAFVEVIEMQIKRADCVTDQPEAFDLLADTLKAQKIRDVQRTDKSVSFHGVTVRDANQSGFMISIDPTIAAVTLPVVALWLTSLRRSGLTGASMSIVFQKSIEALEVDHKVSARLYGSPVTTRKDGWFAFQDLEFTTGHRLEGDFRVPRLGSAYLQVGIAGNSLSLDSLRQLVDLLFDREVLSLR